MQYVGLLGGIPADWSADAKVTNMALQKFQQTKKYFYGIFFYSFFIRSLYL